MSSVCGDFYRELAKLERFDKSNQVKFASKPRAISLTELHILTEAVFFRLYRAYERTIRDAFLLYCLKNSAHNKKGVTPYLKAKSFLHAEELIRSTQRHLDWGNPDHVIQWSILYLKEGYPIKLPITTNLVILADFRSIRNHIAHDSIESLRSYKAVLRKYYGTTPLSIPCPGKFLLENDKDNPSRYKLEVYFQVLRTLITQICR